MGNDSGITAQYGFNFQKLVFIWYMLGHVSRTNSFVYEGDEDLDVKKAKENEYVTLFTNSKNNDSENIQVKSGEVTRPIWIRIVENWINLKNNNQKILIAENELKFGSRDDERMIEDIYADIKEGENKRKDAISKKANDYLSKKFGDDKEQWEKQIRQTISASRVIVRSLNQIEADIEKIYMNDYCLDIIRYQRAKELRVDSFKKECVKKIDQAILEKKSAFFYYNDFTRITTMVGENISDNRYQINIRELKTKQKAKAKEILTNEINREIDQLKLVRDDDSFIINELTKELFYKDFRDVYIDTTKKIDIQNLEDDAFANYEDTESELELMGDDEPQKLFFETTKKQITPDNTLFPGGPIFNHGCYVYLTGQEVDQNIQISWKEENNEI